jgi:hypothetical protein
MSTVISTVIRSLYSDKYSDRYEYKKERRGGRGEVKEARGESKGKDSTIWALFH